MSLNSLERTIDKVLSQKESALISEIDSALQNSLKNLESSKGSLQVEYANIIESSKKQAENLKRQIIGSSTLNARNKELVIIESAIDEIFNKAKEKLAKGNNEKDYEKLLTRMIQDCVAKLGSEIIIQCNSADLKLVKKISSQESSDKKMKITVSDEAIDIIGGIKAASLDGTMTLDNTLDSNIETLKPLIRKDIVQLLRGENK
ncbi:MAG: V-type ATP synthase subunit E [Nitrososphaeraceae archaeon]|jgi:V/A-type H+-transporting ATPase subunit E|nr:V-type ATP synthase subunit E [Nitrososphaeraceae archaeon]MDW0136472.1 V-type ATP synthase subunit E [Nitrososphaeraceae archaeon]MDW0138814.1 V-type ATP synthase subunit E [Nitrososphaeraceae archaeon]MDW0141900.1 V-type ATP synthase subunit E [Nitrososphaeraceae archaeon]MDW0144279.1 V-type ATP synthase subunit E [Nitrososphaeraceae archaeon]